MIEKESDRQTFEKFQEASCGNGERRSKKLSRRELALLHDRIMKLPRPERVAIYLTFWEQKTVAEVACAIDVPRKLAMKLVHRALGRLRDELKLIEKRLRINDQRSAA